MASVFEVAEESERVILIGVSTHEHDDTEESIEELKEISPVFEEDIYEAVNIKTCVERRLTVGAPGPEAMRKVIEMYKDYLAKDWQDEDQIDIPR